MYVEWGKQSRHLLYKHVGTLGTCMLNPLKSVCIDAMLWLVYDEFLATQ